MGYLVIVGFVAIIASLAVALLYMLRGSVDENPEASARKKKMAHALAFRVGFSILLFALVLLSHQLGWIQATGLPLQH